MIIRPHDVYQKKVRKFERIIFHILNKLRRYALKHANQSP